MRATDDATRPAGWLKMHVGRRLQLAGWLLATLSLLVCGTSVASAAPALPSPVPESTWIANGRVTDEAWSGHTLYIGGTFTRIGPPTGPFAVLSGTTGAQQGSWPVVAGGEAAIRTIISDSGGGWYIGGNFTSVDGTPIRNLAHVSASGTLDTAFAPNPDHPVRGLALSADGKTLYVVGNFTQLGGALRSGVAALSTSSGKTLPEFTSGFTPGYEVLVETGAAAVALSSITHTLYVADESQLKAYDTNTGALDNNFKVEGAGDSLAVSPDGQTLYIAGANSIDGQARNGIGAVNATTGAVTSFNPPGNSSYPPGSTALSSDGATLYAGSVAISTATGTIDSNFKPPFSLGALALAPDQSKLYVVGADYSGSLPQPQIAELNAVTGTPESGFSTQPNGLANVIAVSSSGTVAVGGGGQPECECDSFSSLGGAERNWFAAINESTGEPTPLRLDGSNIFAVSPDGGTLYAVKSEPGSNNKLTSKIVSVNTATDVVSSTFAAQLSGYVTALAVSPDGSSLYAAGVFTEADGHLSHDLAAFNPTDGSLKTTFTASAAGNKCGVLTSTPVSALAVSHDDSLLYIGGAFSEVDSHSIAGLAALNTSNGSLDSTFAPGFTNNSSGCEEALSIAANPTGNLLYVGRNIGGINAYDATTGAASAVSTWGASPLALSPDASTLYTAGASSGISEIPFRAVSATTGETLAAVDPVAPNGSSVDMLAFAPDGALAAGGELRNVDQVPVGGFAIFPPASGPPTDGSLPAISRISFENYWLKVLSAGTWGGAQPITYQYQWLRDGQPIPGDTSETHRATAADEGREISVEVIATNASGHTAARSFAYYIPTEGAITPISSEPPQITGTPAVGSTLAASIGAWWSGTTPLTYSYQWLRDGTAIPGVTNAEYIVSSADAGHELAVRVTATNSGGEASAVSSGVSIPPLPGGSGSASTGPTSTSVSNGGAHPSVSEPSGTVIQAALTAALGGGLPTSAALLKAGSHSVSFDAPAAGTLIVEWIAMLAHTSAHHHGAHRRRGRPTVVARGSQSFTTAGPHVLRLRLTVAGRKLLTTHKTLLVKAIARFTLSTSHSHTYTTQTTIRLQRSARQYQKKRRLR